MTGALVHSACNELARRAFKAAGRNYHAEKLAAEHERMRLYYIALYADMERARVDRVPLLIGIELEYSVPALPAGVMVAPKPAPTKWCPECRSAGVVGIEQDVCPTCDGTGKVVAAGVSASESHAHGIGSPGAKEDGQHG